MSPLWRILLYLFPAVILAALLPQYLLLKRRGETNQSLIVKGLCTLVPVIFCLNGCLVNGYIAFWLMLSGLFFYLLGDIAIEKKLIPGISSFMIGHGFFIVAFLIMSKPEIHSVALIFLALFLLSFFIFRKTLLYMKAQAMPFILYAVVLFFMFSIALNLPLQTGTLVMATGTLLIAVSDLLLAKNMAPDRNSPSKRKEAIVLILYYTGLYLLALSVWM